MDEEQISSLGTYANSIISTQRTCAVQLYAQLLGKNKTKSDLLLATDFGFAAGANAVMSVLNLIPRTAFPTVTISDLNIIRDALHKSIIG